MKRLTFALGFAALGATLRPVRAAARHAGTKVTVLPDGLRYVDLIVGKGPKPTRGQTVTVSYVGRLQDGKVFDASSQHGGTFSFPVGTGRVIRGWDEGVATMRVGGTRKLIVPPQLAYGAQGAGGVIPPNATLSFVVELLRLGG